MEHGPLPPHERTWRHPSELAAEEQAVLRAETSPSISRGFALTTGTLGLFAIAILVLAVTPGDQSQPVAVSATTAPAAISPSAPGADRAGSATIASARGVPPASLSRPTGASALATPIGEGRYAIVSQAAIGDGRESELDVTLPSGRITVGEVVERSGDTVLIALSDSEPGHEVAEHRPHDRDVVTVMAEPPVTIAFADVSTLEVAEGTAVIDGDGNLVGLCTKSGHGRRVRLIAIDDEMATLEEDVGGAGADRSVEPADDSIRAATTPPADDSANHPSSDALPTEPDDPGRSSTPSSEPPPSSIPATDDD